MSTCRGRHRWRRLVTILGAVAITTAAFAPGAAAQSDEDEADPLAGLLQSVLNTEPLDPVVDDVVVPNVFVPAGDLLGPIVNELPALTGGTVHVPFPFTYELLIGLLSEPLGQDWADFTIVSTFWERNVRGIVGVPHPIDVNGNGLYDITVEVRDVATTPTLRVVRLPTATKPVNAWLSVGAGSTQLVSSFFIQTEELPALTEITVTDPGFESDQLEARVRTVSPGPSLHVGVTAWFDGESLHIDETLSPVPSEVILTS